MPEIWLKQCPICLADFVPLKDFRFFSCGHKLCSSCLKTTKRDPFCGECRQLKGNPRRIFLGLEDLVDDQVALVASGLNAATMEYSPLEMKDLNCAVRKLGQKFNTDPAVSTALLQAAKDFKERLAPLAKQYSEVKKLNEALNQQVKDLESQAKTVRLRHEKAKLDMENEKEETKRLRLALERQRVLRETEQTENQALQTRVEQCDREIKLLNTKLKALLRKQKVKPTRSAEDLDASLQVESQKESDMLPRQSKRRIVARGVGSNSDSPRRSSKKARLDITELF